MNSHTWRAALLAAGAGVMAVDEVLAGRSQRAFCKAMSALTVESARQEPI